MQNRIPSAVKMEEIEAGIFSTLPESQRMSDYDDKAVLYDRVVGNRFYNRIVWGNWPSRYHAFCAECINAKPGGSVLDAGCGSLVFTAEAYARGSNDSIVLLDRSLGMLRQAKKRLVDLCNAIPDNIVLIQGDIFNLPFSNASFDVVLSQGLLHMFDDKASILRELERVKKEDGLLGFTSLVGNNYLGQQYLSLLQRSGEVASVHSSASLSRLLDDTPYHYSLKSTGNMLYGRTRDEAGQVQR